MDTLEEIPIALEKHWRVISEWRITDLIRKVCFINSRRYLLNAVLQVDSKKSSFLLQAIDFEYQFNLD